MFTKRSFLCIYSVSLLNFLKVCTATTRSAMQSLVKVTYNDQDQASSVQGLHTGDNALWVWVLSNEQGGPTANWSTGPVVSVKNTWHSLAWFCLSEMLTFVIRPISHHSHPLSSFFILSLGILREWMRMQVQAKSFLSLLSRAGNVHLGGHILPGWRLSKAISLPWIWSCMKLKELAQNRPVWRLMSLYSAMHL